MQSTAHTYTSTQLGGLVAQYITLDGSSVRAIATPAGSYTVERMDANAATYAPLLLTQAQARAVFEAISTAAA